MMVQMHHRFEVAPYDAVEGIIVAQEMILREKGRETTIFWQAGKGCDKRSC
jgi:hypothetical protein